MKTGMKCKYCSQIGRRKNRVCGSSPHLALQAILFITVPAGIKGFSAEAFHGATTPLQVTQPATTAPWASFQQLRRILLTFRAGKNSLVSMILKNTVLGHFYYYYHHHFVVEQIIFLPIKIQYTATAECFWHIIFFETLTLLNDIHTGLPEKKPQSSN